MWVLIIFVSFFLYLPTVDAHSANVKGHTDKNSKYISFCNNKYYGYHKKGGINHWHEVVFKSGEWTIINPDELIDFNPCLFYGKQEVLFDKCVDGDTASFIVNNLTQKFRFLAVDTPESVHPKRDVEVYGNEASKYTCEIIKNAQKIEIKFDKNSDLVDKYGRNLVWVWVDGVLLQDLMISEGYAKVSYIYGDYEYIDELCEKQLSAIESNKGVWQYIDDDGYCFNKKNILLGMNDSTTYSVIFLDQGKETTTTVIGGKKAKEVKHQNIKGYKFVGWYQGDKPFDFNSIINSNITLIAKYRADYYFWIATIIIFIISMIKTKKGKKRWKR